MHQPRFNFLFKTSLRSAVGLLAILTLVPSANLKAADSVNVLLIAGEVTKIDKVGHHDYTGGCKCLAELLEQTNSVRCTMVENGWPEDEKLFDGVATVVFYTDGGGKQAFLKTPESVAKLDALAKARVGLVMIHQAADFPGEFEAEGKRWLGGIYLNGQSARGHWDSSHVDFPNHPTTRGVKPWKINDGWLNKIQFVDGLNGITPLVWSGKEYAGSRAGLDQDIVGWTYDRPDNGRSFVFTGLDAHEAWKEEGMRRLVVNGILWTGGIEIPDVGARCEISNEQIDSLLTPREPKPNKKK